MIIGVRSNGLILGADVLMPVDLFVYLILIFAKNKSRQSKYYLMVVSAKILAILFLLISVSGVFFADEPVLVKFQLVHLTRAILIFYCIASRLHDYKHMRYFIIGLLWGLGFQCFIGFYQWQFGPITIPFLETGYGFRVTGTMEVTNAYGAYLVSMIPILARVMLFTDLKPKIIYYVFAAWGLGALYATYTRGAWLAFMGSMVFFFGKEFLGKKVNMKKKLLVIGLSVVVFSTVVVKYGDIIVKRMENSKQSLTADAKQSRMSLAKDAMRVISEHKLFGVGLEHYRFYSDPEIPGLRIVHNAFLLIAAEQGILNFIIFVTLHLIVGIGALKIFKFRDPFLYHVGMGTFTAFIGLLVYHMVAPDYRMIGVLLQHWRLPGMILALLVCNDLTEKRKTKKRRQMAMAGVSGNDVKKPASELSPVDIQRRYMKRFPHNEL
ncbi:O-antigen ligase family protein [candidate division KSB1 bacterium]|nr:O-antigen ligase family protein [candidate division KSB1 bacterium]